MNKRLYLPHDLFELFPTEKIKASELAEGDIVKLHMAWSCTVSSEREFDSYHNEYKQRIICLGNFGGMAFVPSEQEVTILRRDLIDKEKIKELVTMHHAEVAERERWAEEEEKEERARLREMRDELNRELGED